MDKKITDLTLASIINGNDVSVMARDGTDYQFSFSTFLQYIDNNLPTGASVSFGNTLPQNNQGKNGDLFINATDNSFALKINGSWVIKYQNSSVAGNNVLFNLGLPGNGTGDNGDTYIDTGTGIFYKKTNGAWGQVYSIATGPAGPPGFKGDTGVPGANGNGILYGSSNPSNQNTGTDGDFYFNINTWVIFGPKITGAWGTGTPLLQGAKLTLLPIDGRLSQPLQGIIHLIWDTDLQSQFGTDEANIKYLYAIANNQPYKWNTAIQPVYHYDGNGHVSFIEFEGVFDTYFKIIIT